MLLENCGAGAPCGGVRVRAFARNDNGIAGWDANCGALTDLPNL